MLAVARGLTQLNGHLEGSGGWLLAVGLSFLALLFCVERDEPSSAMPGRWDFLAVAFLMVVTGLLYQVGLDTVPMTVSGDEGVNGALALEMAQATSLRMAVDEAGKLKGEPALPFVIQSASLSFHGEKSMKALRTPSALFSAAAVLLFYGLCRLFMDSYWSTVASLILATLPGQLIYARLAETSGFVSLFVIAGGASAIVALRQRSKWLLMLSGFVISCGFHTYLAYAAFGGICCFWVVLEIWLLRGQEQSPGPEGLFYFALGMICGILPLVPFLPSFIDNLRHVMAPDQFSETLSPGFVFRAVTAVQVLLGSVASGECRILVTVPLGLLALPGLCLFLRSNRPGAAREARGLVLFLAAGMAPPLVAAYQVDHPRRFLLILPWIVLLATRAIQLLATEANRLAPESSRRFLKIAGHLILVLFLAQGPRHFLKFCEGLSTSVRPILRNFRMQAMGERRVHRNWYIQNLAEPDEALDQWFLLESIGASRASWHDFLKPAGNAQLNLLLPLSSRISEGLKRMIPELRAQRLPVQGPTPRTRHQIIRMTGDSLKAAHGLLYHEVPEEGSAREAGAVVRTPGLLLPASYRHGPGKRVWEGQVSLPQSSLAWLIVDSRGTDVIMRLDGQVISRGRAGFTGDRAYFTTGLHQVRVEQQVAAGTEAPPAIWLQMHSGGVPQRFLAENCFIASVAPGFLRGSPSASKRVSLRAEVVQDLDLHGRGLWISGIGRGKERVFFVTRQGQLLRSPLQAPLDGLTPMKAANSYLEPAHRWVPPGSRVEAAGDNRLFISNPAEPGVTMLRLGRIVEARAIGGAGDWIQPGSMAVDPVHEWIWIADLERNVLDAYDFEGKLVRSVPAGLPVDLAASPRQGFHAAMASWESLQTRTVLGAIQHEWSGAPVSGTIRLACLPDGSLMVANPSYRRILIYTREGKLLSNPVDLEPVLGPYFEPGEMFRIQDICVVSFDRFLISLGSRLLLVKLIPRTADRTSPGEDLMHILTEAGHLWKDERPGDSGYEEDPKPE